MDRRPDGLLPTWQGVLVDLGLIVVFGLQHSVMARPAFKRRWTRVVPAALERSTYVLLSSVCLVLLMVFWQPWPTVIWDVEWAPARAALWGIFATGLLVSVAASFQIDHFELFGLRRAWASFRGRSCREPEFVEPWLYRIVRHPIQSGVLLMLWSAPTMSAGRLLLAAALTGYILVGIHYEERNLINSIGQRYLDYRERVPGLIPLRPAWFPKRSLPGGILMAMLALGLVAAAFRAGAGEDGDAADNLHYRRLPIDGMDRTYAVFPAGAAGALLVLHGSGGDIERIRRLTGANLTEKLSVQPNIQYVAHPSASLQLQDAYVLGLRFEWGLWPQARSGQAPHR